MEHLEENALRTAPTPPLPPTMAQIQYVDDTFVGWPHGQEIALVIAT